MTLSKISNAAACVGIVSMGLFASGICFAERFGGAFHPNVGNFHYNGYHDNNIGVAGYHYNEIGVGSYRPGYGWGVPVYSVPNYIVNNGVDVNAVNCQSVQQCDAEGNCVETQNCND